MILLPRTIRLDRSDTLIFDRVADPGEWAVPGSFVFWDDVPGALTAKRQQAFRAGFLGLTSFGWSTLVEVAEVEQPVLEAATAALAVHIRSAFGAPDDAAALAAAKDEIGFARSLCDHPPGTVLAMTRRHDADGAVREQFRTLHRREGAAEMSRLPVFAAVSEEGADEPPVHPDLAAMAKDLP